MSAKHNQMHSVMPKRLAEALIEAGIKHFDIGGMMGPPQVAGIDQTPRGPATGPVPTQSIPPQQVASPAMPAVPSNFMQPMGGPQGAQSNMHIQQKKKNVPAPTSGTVTTMPVQQPVFGGSTHVDGSGLGQSTSAPGGNPYHEASEDFSHGDIGGGIMSGSNPREAINGIGAGIQGIGQAFTAQNTYNASLAPQMQSDYSGLIQQGGTHSLNTYQQQQNLANALMMQSQGIGPNPAQDQLNQNTANNVANQSAMMAGQRGASSNPALIARQAAMQGSNAQQNSIGQAAGLQAQQELAAQQQAIGLYGQMGNQSNQLFGTSLAGQNTQNANSIQNYAMAQGINAQVAQGNVNAQNATTGSILGALGGGGASMFAEGGQVASVQVPQLAPSEGVVFTSGGGDDKKKKKKGDEGGDVAEGGAVADVGSSAGGSAGSSSLGSMASMFADGGDVYAPESGGDVASGGGSVDIGAGGSGGAWAKKKDSGGGGGGGLMSMLPLLAMLEKGGGVPGKAKVKGNNLKNDQVPALLSPGEIVLPRSVTQAPDMEKKAIEFLRHIKKNKKAGYDDVQSARIAKKACGGRIY